MHTNGGDRWLVFDRILDKVVDASRSQVKAREMTALLNTALNIAADWFCHKPRYEMRRWDEYTNTVQKTEEADANSGTD